MQGKGWLSARWPDGAPTAAALDTVTGDRPAALWAHDHHTLWVNSAAMRRPASTPPTACLQEWDAWRFPLPAPTGLERLAGLADGMREANARGVICVHDFQAHGGREIWQRWTPTAGCGCGWRCRAARRPGRPPEPSRCAPGSAAGCCAWGP